MKQKFIVYLMLFVSISLIAEDSVKIYVIYVQGYTNVQDYVSAEDLRGATLAVEKANEQGGVLGMRIEIIDGRTVDITAGKQAAQDQIELNEIIAVVGANISNLSMLIGPVFQNAGIPMVSPISTHPRVTSIGDYIFRTCFTDPFQGKIMAIYANQQLSASTAVILTKATSTFSNSLSDFFIDEFQKNGRILSQEFYNIDEDDIPAMLNRIKSLNPDVVFVPGHGSDAGYILKTAHALNLNAIFLGGDGWGKGTLGVAGDEAAEGHYFVNHWHPDVPSSESRDFVRRYRDTYGDGPIAGSAALAYDAMNIIINAIRTAGSLERRAVRDAIKNTSRFSGVTGVISFDQTGDPIGKAAVIMQYVGGEIQFRESITP